MKTGIRIDSIKYHVNAEKKTVACIIESSFGTFVGKAKCSKHDTFDEVKGRRIAESRAKEKIYRTAYKTLFSITMIARESYHRSWDRTVYFRRLADREALHVLKLCEE